MDDEGQPMVEDVSLRDNIDLYSELQSKIIWLQGEIAKLTDGNPCKPALMEMLPNHDEIPQYYVRQLIGEFILHLDVDYTNFGSEFYGVSKGCLADRPSDTGGDHVDSRPSHGNRSRIPQYVSNDEVHHMSVEDLRSMYFECRDYIHGTYIAARECGYRTIYVDSTYEMEHGQASFLNAIVDDACREFATSTSMLTDVMTCPDTTPMASIPESVLGSQTHDPMTSPLGLEDAGIDGHRVIGRWSRQTDEYLEDGNRSQRLRREIDTEDIVPPRDSVSS
eukprot:Gb_29493 [translate_table: standard]